MTEGIVVIDEIASNISGVSAYCVVVLLCARANVRYVCVCRARSAASGWLVID